MTSDIIGRLKHLPVWLARCRHCRGFGVQSPWAYAFIRYVIGERWLYYAYKELDLYVKSLDDNSCKVSWNDCRLNHLYFRISNYVRAETVLDFSSERHIYTMYINAGCSRSKILNVPVDMCRSGYSLFLDKINSVDFVMLSMEGQWRDFFIEARKRSNENTLFVVRGINSSEEARRAWKEIVSDKENIVTFDLYYCGIVFFDRKRYKQNYIVNF